MADFRRDFRAAPVPIRLSCPFSNGITLNYYARAMSCTSRVLRVISVNPFERELQLFVAAPFISGISRCMVASVTRSKRQASTFEIDLRFMDAPILLSKGDQSETAGATDLAASTILSADIAAAATELALLLESSVGIPFAKAYAQARNQNRHLKLLALIASLCRLLQEKSLASNSVLQTAVKRQPASSVQGISGTPQQYDLSERRVG